MALDDISLSVARRTIVGLIGPNGSGKTTFINLVTGFVRPSVGDLLFDGKDITDRKPHEIARLGIGRTFQEPRVFKKMTAIENVLVASPSGTDKKSIEKARELLRRVELFDVRNEHGGNLSYGQRKLLEFARLLMLDPELVLIDEPTAGINPILIGRLLNYFRELRDRGKTIIMVEHNMHVVNDVCEKVYVLDHGERIAYGTPQEIQRNDKVKDAYLGSG